MEQLTSNSSPEEAAEIERHKYFLSEEAGYDVGWEFAKTDWEDNFRRQFRQDHVAHGQAVSRGPFLKRFLSRFTSKSR